MLILLGISLHGEQQHQTLISASMMGVFALPAAY
jgi:hypothetical protein